MKKHRPDENTPPINFKIEFLHELVQELHLTRTRQKVTIFHSLALIFPAVGLSVAIAWAHGNHDWKSTIAAFALGPFVGFMIAWLFPRVLWRMLFVFAQYDWFIQSRQEGIPPTMTREQFISRSKQWAREDAILKFVVLLAAVGASCIAAVLGDSFEWTRSRPWLMIIVLVAIWGTMISAIGTGIPFGRWLLERNRLSCPACGRPITLTDTGCCWVCHARIIENMVDERATSVPLMSMEEFRAKIAKWTAADAALKVIYCGVAFFAFRHFDRLEWSNTHWWSPFVFIVVMFGTWLAAGIKGLPFARLVDERYGFNCPACGEIMGYISAGGRCPQCGAKVVDMDFKDAD